MRQRLAQRARPPQNLIDNTTVSIALNTLTANTKSAWVELTPSTNDELEAIWLVTVGGATSATKVGVLLDIGVGAAGSEVVHVANVNMAQNPPSPWENVTMVPVRIPKGSRVAFRLQASDIPAASFTVNQAYGIPARFPNEKLGQFIDTYGASTGTSAGVTVNGSNISTTTWGAWTAISTGVSRNYRAALLAVGGPALTVDSNVTGFVQMGIGTVSAIDPVGPTIPFRTTTIELCHRAPCLPFPCRIPEGAYVSARVMSNVASQGITATAHLVAA